MLYWALLDLTTMRITNKEYIMNVIIGTLSLEGIELSDQSMENLNQYTSGEKSFDELLSEIRDRYKHEEDQAQ